MSYFDYIAFPRELKAFPLSDIKGKEKDYGINYDISKFRNDILVYADMPLDEPHMIIYDKKEATFKNCFKNPFIYEFCVCLPPNTDWLTIMQSDLDAESKEKELEESAKWRWLLHKQVLCDFISQNIDAGEFAEIYTECTDHIHFDLGPPDSECAFSIEEFLNLPPPETIYDKRKTTIYR